MDVRRGADSGIGSDAAMRPHARVPVPAAFLLLATLAAPGVEVSVDGGRITWSVDEAVWTATVREVPVPGAAPQRQPEAELLDAPLVVEDGTQRKLSLTLTGPPLSDPIGKPTSLAGWILGRRRITEFNQHASTQRRRLLNEGFVAADAYLFVMSVDDVDDVRVGVRFGEGAREFCAFAVRPRDEAARATRLRALAELLATIRIDGRPVLAEVIDPLKGRWPKADERGEAPARK
jgi:hypothetical protein